MTDSDSGYVSESAAMAGGRRSPIREGARVRAGFALRARPTQNFPARTTSTHLERYTSRALPTPPLPSFSLQYVMKRHSRSRIRLFSSVAPPDSLYAAASSLLRRHRPNTGSLWLDTNAYRPETFVSRLMIDDRSP